MIGDDVSADLGDGAIEMGFQRYLGEWPREMSCSSVCALPLLTSVHIEKLKPVNTNKAMKINCPTATRVRKLVKCLIVL
jgi:hypothetical protein